jgi:hypothetical protein
MQFGRTRPQTRSNFDRFACQFRPISGNCHILYIDRAPDSAARSTPFSMSKS